MFIHFNTGDPPTTGKYIVTDGEEVAVDYWLEFNGRLVRLPSDEGTPGENVYRQWSRHENVTGWATTTSVLDSDVLQLLKDLRQNHPSDGTSVKQMASGEDTLRLWERVDKLVQEMTK